MSETVSSAEGSNDRELSSAPRLRWQSLVAVLALAAIAICGWRIYRGLHVLKHNAPVRLDNREHAFRLTPLAIPFEQIRSGGPSKDGIPALTQPPAVAASEVSYLQDTDRVLGIALPGEARAYPLRILGYHEVVNDRIGELPVLVTYCPLCDASAVFERRVDGKEREFGVSGLLYQSNVLLYDRKAGEESLWSQMLNEGVAGPQMGTRLKPVPFEVTSWQDWRRRHPETQVLSTETGHRRDYGKPAYRRYLASDRLMFPVSHTSTRLPPKTPVLGVWTADGQKRAYPVEAFSDEPQILDEQLGDARYRVIFDPEARSLRIADADDGVRWIYSFWFAWYAFHTDTELWQPAAAGM